MSCQSDKPWKLCTAQGFTLSATLWCSLWEATSSVVVTSHEIEACCNAAKIQVGWGRVVGQCLARGWVPPSVSIPFSYQKFLHLPYRGAILHTSPWQVYFKFIFFMWDCTFGQVSRQNRPEGIPANPSHSLIEKKVWDGTQMVDVLVGAGGWNKPPWYPLNVLLAMHRTFMYLLNVGGKVTHTSFPVEDVPLRRRARPGFPQQKSLFEGGTQWGALGLPVASGTGRLPSHQLQLQVKEEQQAGEDLPLKQTWRGSCDKARNPWWSGNSWLQ